MAQKLITDFVAELSRAIELPEPIVEFGSLRVEAGQDGDLRPLFAGRDFTGTDLREGTGVDRVEDLRSLSFADGEVGTSICLDTLEHCDDPAAACRELRRVTAANGVCIISSVMLFGIHSYPSDYFRFTPEGLRSLLGGFADVWVAGIGDPQIPVQVVGVGARDRRLDLSLESFSSLSAAQAHWEQARGRIRVGPLRFAPAELARIFGRELARNARARLSRSLSGRSR